MSRSLQKVLSRLERLEVLYKVSNIINTTLEPQEVLRLLLEEVVRITDATSGSIAMIDHRKGILNIETAINIPSRLWKKLKLEIGVGVTGYVAWTGKPMRVDDVTRDPHYVRLKADIRSEMALPMIVEGKVIGVINVDSTRVRAFTRDDEELCMAVANQSAKVIETARLHAAVKRHADEMEALFTVGRTLIEPGPLEQLLERIVRESNRMLSGKVCVLMEVTDSGEIRNWAVAGASQQWRDKPPIRVTNSLLGQVVKKRTPLKVIDVRTHPKFRYAELAEEEGVHSMLAVPLIFQESVLALLAVFTQEQRRFRPSEIRLLQLLANQGAIAIENVRRMERLTQLEERLRSAERFSLLGTLAAEIAHEIRNPITIINLLMHGIQANANHDEQMRSDLKIVTQKLDRINGIVEQTLNLARSNETNFKPGNLNGLIEEILLFLNYKLSKAEIRVDLALDPKIGDIAMDAGQIQQVLLNLIINAMNAMPEKGGRLSIRTRLASDRTLGPCVRCQIRDNGCGIPPEHAEHIFDAFFTLREGGTGLGLFVSNKLVRRHGGIIKVKSTPGEGSTFTITLPLRSEES